MRNGDVTMQTGLPDHIQRYLRQLGLVHYGSLGAVYEDMVSKFLVIKPWAAARPLAWREAPTRYGAAGCAVANVKLSNALAAKVVDELEEINKNVWPGHESRGITRKTFLYTAVYWWVTFVYPQPRP